MPPSIENEKIAELSRYAESLTADTAKLKTKCEAVSNQAILRSLKTTNYFCLSNVASC